MMVNSLARNYTEMAARLTADADAAYLLKIAEG
jgi:hypothetical protein